MWRELDAVEDHDVPCASVGAVRQRQPDGSWIPADSAVRSKDCSGVIPTGERHYKNAWAIEEFKVTLTRVNRADCMLLLHVLRQQLEIGLVEAKKIIDTYPQELRSFGSREEAQTLVDALHTAGGVAEITHVARRRYCRSCVRAMNDATDGDKPILVKVELTYSDGTMRYLEDEAADDWSHDVSAMSMMAFVHGQSGKPAPWKERKNR